MESYLQNLQAQILEALAIGRQAEISKKHFHVQKILFCAMGGSAISGDILRALSADTLKIPFIVNRSNSIPKWADKNTLGIFSSYSGSTKETLDCLQQAIKRKLKIFIITSNGELRRIAVAKKIPCLQIPDGLPPRCAVGYLTFSLIPIFMKNKWVSIQERDIKETLSEVHHPPVEEAKQIAKKLFGRSIHIYGLTGPTEVTALRWRAQLAENSKTLSSHYVMPEMFHNEVEGWVLPKAIINKSAAVFLEDESDPIWIRKKRDFVKEMLTKKNAEVVSVISKGKSLLSRIFSLIYLGDWVSFQLANLEKIDPLEIPNIDLIKKVE